MAKGTLVVKGLLGNLEEQVGYVQSPKQAFLNLGVSPYPQM